MIDERNGSLNASMISRLALERYSRWRTNQPSENGEDWIKTALAQTDWLAANLECSNGVGVWRIPFPASFGAEPGWTSGFTNAHGIAALLIMSRFIPDPERYIKPALCAIGPFETELMQGGFVTQDAAGPWFEEYATPQRSGVLNGHVFALAGLWYACTYAEVDRACALFTKGTAALKDRLPRYDVGFTSKYSLVEGNYASPGYNQLHAQVLEWLYGVTNDPVFKQYSDRFADYEAEDARFTPSFTADPFGHGADQLNDGYLWYGYWSAFGGATTIDVDMPSSSPVTGLVLAFFGDEPLPFEYAVVDEAGFAGPYTQAPAPAVTRYVLQEHHTTVGVYPVNFTAKSIRIRLTTPIPGTDVVALREINILH